MTKFLVTGSSGLVGRQVVKDLVAENFDVYSCYHIEKPEFGILTHLDISKKEEIVNVLEIIKPDVIIHLAAMTDVDMCETQKDLAVLINTKATEILAREAARHDAFFVYMSTDYVFDGKKGMRNEDDDPKPVNFYGKSKLDAEIALSGLVSSYAIVRTSTPFGIHPKKKNFPLWVKESLESKKETAVLIDQYTSPTFVPNLSKMVVEISIRKITGLIHLAGASRLSRYEFAKIIADKLSLDTTLLKPTKIAEMSWRAQRPHDSSLDVSKANKILSNKPQKIEQCIDLFVTQVKTVV
ncbi:MAG: dTDP-4-dehydrorhamnose reductase [Thermoproteota archaeon]